MKERAPFVQKRLETIMYAPIVSRRAFIEAWVRALLPPPVVAQFDLDGLALAFQDLAGEGDLVSLAEDRLDVLTEWALDIADGGIEGLEAELERSGEFLAAARALAWAFARSSGLKATDPEVRALRRAIVLDFVEALEGPVRQRESRRVRARVARERYYAFRHPCETDLGPGFRLSDGDRDPRDPHPGPATSAAARECALRTVDLLRGKIRPDVLAALKARFLEPDGASGAELARRFGFSEATFSRARRLCGEIVRKEGLDLPEEVRAEFARYVVQALAAPGKSPR